LKEAFILHDLKGTDKKDVLMELSDAIALQISNINRDDIFEALFAREQLGSTGMEEGVAIPHAKVQDLSSIVIAFGRSIKGVDFQSIDSKPTKLIFLLLAPEGSSGDHLKILARISRMLKDEEFRNQLLEAKGKEEIFKTIMEYDRKF
jgi:PTS system nitrogen regulatory IIA component